MTRFHEISTPSWLTDTITAPELEDYIGSFLIWQEPCRLTKSLGVILEVDFNLTSVLVTISTKSLGIEEIKKFSFTRETKVKIVKVK